jgi:hypothetical protein
MSAFLEKAKRVLSANEAVRFGIFGIVASSEVFPPREFLNEFFAVGYDPCDQDRRMTPWEPFSLSPLEYGQIKDWWVTSHDGACEDGLGTDSWQDWVQELLSR